MSSDSPSLTATQSKILSYIEGELTRSGRPPTLRDIAKHFGYRAVSTVQDHVAALLKKGFLEREKGTVCGLKPAGFAESLSVPILGAVPAGRPIEAIHDAQGFISAPARLKGELFALRVKGDSMIDAGIMEGDLVIVRKQDTAEHGQIVVATIDGEATVKTLEKRGGRIRLLPANPRYSPIELQETRDNAIQGRVVGVQRTY